MAKELLKRALRGERVEQTPWLPHIGTHAAQLLNVSAERYLQDSDLLITPHIFPLREAVEQIKEIRESLLMVTGGAASRFR